MFGTNNDEKRGKAGIHRLVFSLFYLKILGSKVPGSILFPVT